MTIPNFDPSSPREHSGQHGFPTTQGDEKRVKTNQAASTVLTVQPPQTLPGSGSRWSSSSGTRSKDGMGLELEYEWEQYGIQPPRTELNVNSSADDAEEFCPFPTQIPKGITSILSNPTTSKVTLITGSFFDNLNPVPSEPCNSITFQAASLPKGSDNSALIGAVPLQPLKKQAEDISTSPKEPASSALIGKDDKEKWVHLLKEGDGLDKIANIQRLEKERDNDDVFVCTVSNNVTKILDRLPAREAYSVSENSFVATDDLKELLEKTPKAKEGFLSWIETLLFYYDIDCSYDAENGNLYVSSLNEAFEWETLFENKKDISNMSRMLNSCVVLGFKDLAVRIFTILENAPENKIETLKIWEKALEGALQDPEMQKIRRETALLCLENEVKALERSVEIQEKKFKPKELLRIKRDESAPKVSLQNLGSGSENIENQLKLRKERSLKRMQELADLDLESRLIARELRNFGFINGRIKLHDTHAPYTLDELCEKPVLFNKYLVQILKSIPALKYFKISGDGIEIEKIPKTKKKSVLQILRINLNRIFDVLLNQYGFEIRDGKIVKNKNFNREFLRDARNFECIARLLNAAVLFGSKEKAIDFLIALKTNTDINEEQVIFLEDAIYSAFGSCPKDGGAWLQFYLEGGVDDLGRTLDEILKRGPIYKEKSHNYYQRMFRTKEPSKADPFAPLATKEMIDAFRAQDEQGLKLRSALKRCYLSMLEFYGFQENKDGSVVKSASFEARSAWLHINNQHNFLRITRILSSLTLLGLKDEAIHFHQTLCSLYSEKRCNDPKSPDFIPMKTREFWKAAVTEIIS